ncbi:MAG: hypothetical protein AAGJ08_08990 [Cyanobacteria bacterium P01_H01_bin.35]
MKIQKMETLLTSPEVETNSIYLQARHDLEEAIKQVEWPEGNGKFTIYPESGKKRGEGNGVKPIKVKFIEYLEAKGWRKELSISDNLGNVDAVFNRAGKIIAVEWETGNISSSHRSINKMAFAIQRQDILAGFLIVPCRTLAKYLTDRIGNFEELEPYFDFWRNCTVCYPGILIIIGIEYDDTSYDVPKIPKGTSGRAKN